jgi:hypothetical protein
MHRGASFEAAIAEFAELWQAETPEDLHYILIMHSAARRSADTAEPLALFKKHHEIDPASSLDTAVLLLTDRRWQKGAGQLVRHIASSEVLDQETLDLLAEMLLADAVRWEAPAEWFEGGLVISFGEDGPVITEDVAALDHPAVVRRAISPPLRRWAAGWQLRRDPACRGRLRSRAADLDPRAAAAVMAGLLDEIDCLDPEAQGPLIAETIRWPQPDVRRLALTLMAKREGVDAAVEVGRDDPSALVRDFAESLLRPPPPGRRRAQPGVERGSSAPEGPEPLTLF